MSDSDKARRIHSLLVRALDLPANEREGFLDRECGDDRDLRSEVASLLSDAGEAERYFDEIDSDLDEAFGSEAGDPGPETGPAETLEVGRRIGHFRIIGRLGEGAMGVVYRATDLRLGRDVALKLLPSRLTGDTEAAKRFEQEARLLASLSHPSIASIFGTHEEDGLRVLVLELVDGPGLDERLERRRLSMRESLEIAMHVARGLEVAHRAGIVHRDLKPSNIRIDKGDGIAKVLDFGIATILPEVRPGHDRDLVSTEAGRILGTVTYMSPEQARGEKVDERTDIWALGCVLYEMLTGERAFAAPTVTDTLAAILQREPDWSALPDSTPPEIVRLLQRCLRKDARRRLRHAGDLWLVLDEALAGPPNEPAGWRGATPTGGRRRLLTVLVVGIGAALAGLTVGLTLDRAAPPEALHLEMLLAGEELRTPVGGRAVAISTDGRQIVHTADGELHLRPLEAFEDEEVPGAVGAETPVFSPDGEWLAFFARGQLRKISLLGGEPFSLCGAPLPRGADWAADDRIVFSDGTSILVVDAGGGACRTLASPPEADDSRRFVWPSWLPDGRILFQETGTEAAISILEPETGGIVRLPITGNDPRYLPDGRLLFGRLGTVYAVDLVLAEDRVEGSPRPLVDDVAAESTGAVHLAISRSGTLVYVPTLEPPHTLVWVDRRGGETPLTEVQGDYSTPRVAPKGERVAVVIRQAGERQIWVHETSNDTFFRAIDMPSAIWPAWTPDGRRISFSGSREGPATIWWQEPGAGNPQRLSSEGIHQYAATWARNREVIAWFQPGAGGTRDIWAQRAAGERGAFPVVETPAHDQGPALSPDGRWIAYASNATGRNEIYLEACRRCADDDTLPEGRWRVSTNGGGEPLWSPDGAELLYREGSRVMVVAVRLGGSEPALSPPVELFSGPYVIGQSGNPNWDIAPDGARFLMVKPARTAGSQRLRLVLNWSAGSGP